MNLEKTYYSHDARPFAVSDAPAGEYRAIEVSGGHFQLATRLVVYNECPVGIATQDAYLRKKFQGTREHVLTSFTKLQTSCVALWLSLDSALSTK
ncbi:hypothetical protein V1506DRAFT_528334 [Lipomyces tetrasporus]